MKPSKIDTFLLCAFVLSRLSPDEQTKHGCVITDAKNRILGTGYNGFPRDADDDSLPKTRPDKYVHILHSEINCLLNCGHRPEGGIAYVTGYSCYNCLIHMWQAGVKTVYQADRGSFMVDATQEKLKADFLAMPKITMEVHTVKPDFTFVRELIKELHQLGFMHTEFGDNKDLFNAYD